MVKKYRTNGAIGALMDEYEKALLELQELLSFISNEELMQVVDTETKNLECISIQSILAHVVKAGNWYNIEIRNALGEELDNPELKSHSTVIEYQEDLTKMFESSELIFTEYTKVDIYLKRKFRWEPIHNIDILLEHAIVHVLRHRRQIERFILELRKHKPS